MAIRINITHSGGGGSKNCFPLKSGSTTGLDGSTNRGTGVSRTILSFNNHFGNTNRFTDTLGGQSYANGIVLDWATWDEATGEVYFCTLSSIPAPSNDYAGLVTAVQSLTTGGFNDWEPMNQEELMEIPFYWGGNGYGTRWLPPWGATLNGLYILSCTDTQESLGINVWGVNSNALGIPVSSISKADVNSQYRMLGIRIGNISEL